MVMTNEEMDERRKVITAAVSKAYPGVRRMTFTEEWQIGGPLLSLPINEDGVSIRLKIEFDWPSDRSGKD